VEKIAGGLYSVTAVENFLTVLFIEETFGRRLLVLRERRLLLLTFCINSTRGREREVHY